MSNLFALCRNDDHFEVKRVSLANDVQQKVIGIFQAQAVTFMDGVSDEVEFSGNWKPDDDEILTLGAPEEVQLIQVAAEAPLEVNVVPAANFAGEGIRGLCVAIGENNPRRLLIQLFSAQQLLARRFSLLLQGDTFRELTAPAFTLDNSLTAIVEDGHLKFKAFVKVKRVFALTELYQEASNPQIEEFCGHANISVGDVDGFKAHADQTTRKMIHAVLRAGVLDNATVDDIVTKAGNLGIEIALQDGKIAMPTERKDLKILLRFLDDGIYKAALTDKRYVTNSKRPLG